MYQGFDEYMNLVLDEAEEVNIKSKQRKAVGKYGCWKRCNLIVWV